MFSHLLLLLCLITGSLGAVPCLCENQDLEVHRDSTAILNCGCLSKENSIVWSINGELVTQCPSFSNEEKQETCKTLNSRYNISAKRTSASSSVLTVSSGSLSKLNNVSCAVPETEEETTCKVDLIYPANESSCHVKVDTGRDTGGDTGGDTGTDTGRDTGGDTGTDTVSAHCSITKAYSANGRYRCDLYQVLQNETKSQLLSTTTIKTLSRDSEGDMRGECSITARVLRGGELKMLITPGGVEINLNRNDDPKDISTTFPQGHFHPGHIGLPTDLPDKDSTVPLELTTDHVTTSGGATTTSPPDVATTCTRNVAGWFAGGVCLGLLIATVAILCCRGRWKVHPEVANARPQGDSQCP
ncbi:uncharacterized protein LOC112563249 [Pomacea canaliculata]|uniref:uncharacterized protein LOC112563249 n=1 Tax=Pomacea canaliculata TaxID=400727 RepID=UPI000D73EA6A|nr:uncharacterized protein LOC112563249 [Pomacea canaliculata]